MLARDVSALHDDDWLTAAVLLERSDLRDDYVAFLRQHAHSRLFPKFRAAADDEVSTRLVRLGDLRGDVAFTAVEREAREELAVGQVWQVLAGALDAGVSFDVTVPRGDVAVADGPVDGDAFARMMWD